jgi:hypothetical protein
VHWDGTITLGNVLTIITGAVFFLAFYAKIVNFLAIMKEYPPHRHNLNVIYYPSTMKPGPMEKHR